LQTTELLGRVTVFHIALYREILQYKSTQVKSHQGSLQRPDFQQDMHKKGLAAGPLGELERSPRLSSRDGGREKGRGRKKRRKGEGR